MMIGFTQWDVFVSGDIDKNSPEKFRKSVENIHNVVYVHLDSPGGNLISGMEIGRIIRKLGFSTYVNKQIPGTDKTQKGECYSACALTFLGGNFRFIDKESIYGVHRFYNENSLQPSKDDLDTGQILTTAIANYINEMGVNSSLMNLIVSVGKNEMYVLSNDEIKSLEVTNDGRLKPEWTIESVEGGQYLKGLQYTSYGLGKTIFYCNPNKSISILSVYEFGEEPMKRWVHSLIIDDKTYHLNPIGEVKIYSNGFINTNFNLTPELARLIYKSQSFGHAMQMTVDAPTFKGYRVEIPENKRPMIKNFIENCLSK